MRLSLLRFLNIIVFACPENGDIYYINVIFKQITNGRLINPFTRSYTRWDTFPRILMLCTFLPFQIKPASKSIYQYLVNYFKTIQLKRTIIIHLNCTCYVIFRPWEGHFPAFLLRIQSGSDQIRFRPSYSSPVLARIPTLLKKRTNPGLIWQLVMDLTIRKKFNAVLFFSLHRKLCIVCLQIRLGKAVRWDKVL